MAGLSFPLRTAASSNPTTQDDQVDSVDSQALEGHYWRNVRLVSLWRRGHLINDSLDELNLWAVFG